MSETYEINWAAKVQSTRTNFFICANLVQNHSPASFENTKKNMDITYQKQ